MKAFPDGDELELSKPAENDDERVDTGEAITELLDLPTAHTFGPVQVDDGSGRSGVSDTAAPKFVEGY